MLAAPAQAARLALVMGNNDYTFVKPSLLNAVQDARDFGRALKEGGFDEVVVAVNLTRDQMNEQVRQLLGRVAGGDEVVVYFAGHGVQLSGVSFLLPVDVRDNDAMQVRDDAFPLHRLLEDLAEKQPRFTLVIVDACRDNPFGGKMRAAGTRGLAPTSPAEGQMVVYSAGANQRALDRLGDRDNSPNGVFMRVWLEQMRNPGVPVHDVVRSVRQEVRRLAQSVGHTQVPAMYDQSVGSFPLWMAAAPSKSPPPTPAPTQKATPQPAPPPPPPTAQPAPTPLGKTWRDCESCPELVVIPAGEFEMGSPEGEGDDDEHPAHGVRIRSFALGKFEVTQGQWRALMGTSPSEFKDCGDDCPVDRVSWEDARAYIAKLNKKVSGSTSGPYRLPSEAEWEYACRGGRRQTYCGSDNPDTAGWYSANSSDRTQKVGRKPANGFGVHDMSGSVPEWVEDCWNWHYRGAPQDGSAWTTGECTRRVARGGGWFHQAPYLRAADRTGDQPANRDLYWGFRVARSLP